MVFHVLTFKKKYLFSQMGKILFGLVNSMKGKHCENKFVRFRKF